MSQSDLYRPVTNCYKLLPGGRDISRSYVYLIEIPGYTACRRVRQIDLKTFIYKGLKKSTVDGLIGCA